MKMECLLCISLIVFPLALGAESPNSPGNTPPGHRDAYKSPETKSQEKLDCGLTDSEQPGLPKDSGKPKTSEESAAVIKRNVGIGIQRASCEHFQLDKFVHMYLRSQERFIKLWHGYAAEEEGKSPVTDIRAENRVIRGQLFMTMEAEINAKNDVIRTLGAIKAAQESIQQYVILPSQLAPKDVGSVQEFIQGRAERLKQLYQYVQDDNEAVSSASGALKDETKKWAKSHNFSE